MRISEQYYSIKNNILFCVAVPLFVMLFMVIYQPLFYGEADMLQHEWHEHESLCLPVVCAIALGVLAASRTLLCLTLVRHNLSRREWLLWQATEWVVGSLFVDLFLSLFFGMGYFALLPHILLTAFALVVVPYICYWLAIELIDRDIRLRQSDKLLEEMR